MFHVYFLEDLKSGAKKVVPRKSCKKSGAEKSRAKKVVPLKKRQKEKQ